MRKAGILATIAVALVSAPAAAPQTPDAVVQQIIGGAPFKAAAAFITADQDRFVRDLITLTEIAAPPFKEQARAAAFLQMLKREGLSDVETDAEGNVMGLRPGAGTVPAGGQRGILVVSAHLDTVFPEGTDVKVKRTGTRLQAPGVGDDTRGLALLLALVRALHQGGFQTGMDVLFLGNVGEEGEGDLRGVKFLLHKGKYKDRI